MPGPEQIRSRKVVNLEKESAESFSPKVRTRRIMDVRQRERRLPGHEAQVKRRENPQKRHKMTGSKRIGIMER